MFGKQDIEALQLRKQALVLESELNRLALRAEFGRLREAASWITRIEETRSRLSSWALTPALIAGLAFMVGLRRSESTGFLSRALRLAPGLVQLWWTCMCPPSQSK